MFSWYSPETPTAVVYYSFLMSDMVEITHKLFTYCNFNTNVLAIIQWNEVHTVMPCKTKTTACILKTSASLLTKMRTLKKARDKNLKSKELWQGIFGGQNIVRCVKKTTCICTSHSLINMFIMIMLNSGSPKIETTSYPTSNDDSLSLWLSLFYGKTYLLTQTLRINVSQVCIVHSQSVTYSQKNSMFQLADQATPRGAGVPRQVLSDVVGTHHSSSQSSRYPCPFPCCMLSVTHTFS